MPWHLKKARQRIEITQREADSERINSVELMSTDDYAAAWIKLHPLNSRGFKLAALCKSCETEAY
jgi:hypothetical protein